MEKTISLARILLMSSVLLLPTSGRTQPLNPEDYNGYVGGQAGMGVATNNLGTRLNFGATAGWTLSPDLVVAAFVNSVSFGNVSSATLSLIDSSQRSLFYGLEADTSLKRFALSGVTLGLKVGLSSSNVRIPAAVAGIPATDVNATHLFVGPKLAYDYALANQLAVGAEANVLFKTTSAEPIATFRTPFGLSTLFNFLGQVKFTF